jgi:phage tail sheath protein FI
MYKTPGVYVEEISTLPPSVAEVSTAIPAFIGHTEKGPAIKRINTLLEYEEAFGKAKPTSFTVQTHTDTDTKLEVIDSVTASKLVDGQPEFLMYYALAHYFKNGGGPCYIIPAGNYDVTPAKAGFEVALKLVAKEDEPTLIVLTDAVKLLPADYYELSQQALAQCAELGDRFTILDVHDGDVSALRDSIGTNALMYGAAYYPYLKTTLNYRYQDIDIEVQSAGSETVSPAWQKAFGDNGIVVFSSATADTLPETKIIGGSAGDGLEFTVDDSLLTIRNAADRTGVQVVEAWTIWSGSNDPGSFSLDLNGDGLGEVPHTSNRNIDLVPLESGRTVSLASLKEVKTGLYNAVKAMLVHERVVLPPSAAIAGIYARVDRNRGVWKAPANVSVSAVMGPVTKTTALAQEGLNVDPTAGKSINAIRMFTGKGTLVWGARTLAGNDNEWRYVSVRRLFIMIEESVQKSTAFAVFEGNDATTWMKVKGMIESYLYGLWERGALAGPTPQSAYFVNVGLGTTMTTQDIRRLPATGLSSS